MIKKLSPVFSGFNRWTLGIIVGKAMSFTIYPRDPALHLFHVICGCRYCLATDAIRCVFFHVICGCPILRVPYFVALRGPVTGRHGKSRYLPSNVCIFNRKQQARHDLSRIVTVCHALKLEPFNIKSTPSNDSSNCSHLMAINGLPSNDLKM